MGLGTFLTHSFDDVSNWAGDVGGFVNRDVARPTIGGLEKIPGVGRVLHDAGHGLMNLAQWDRDVYTNVVSRPISTLGLVGINMNSWGDAFKGSTWSKSYDESAYVSPGQSLMGNVDAMFNFDGDTRNQRQEDQYLQGVFSDPTSVDTYFHNGSMLDKLGSGSFDAALGWYTDPSALVGHSLSGLRASIHAANGVSTGADAVKSLNRTSVQKTLDATDKMSPYQAKKLSFISKSNNPDLLSSIFNSHVDRGLKEAAYRMMVSNGNDQVARQALEDAATSAYRQSGRQSFVKGWGSTADQAGSIMESLANAQQKINPEIRLAHIEGMSAGPGGWDALSEALHGTMDDLQKKINIDGTQGRMVSDILGMKGHITWQPGRFDVPIATMRAAFQGADKFGDITKIASHIPGGTTLPGQWVTQTLYKGLYQTPLKVLRAFGDAWPDGWIDYTNPKSGDTLESFLTRARGMDVATRQGYLNQYYQAGTDVGKKQVVVAAAEHAAAKAVLMAKGATDEDAESILNGTYEKRNQRLQHTTQRAQRPMTQAFSAAPTRSGRAADVIVHALDDGDGVPIHVPILETMKRQGTPLLDLDQLNDWASRNLGKFQFLRNAGHSATDIFTNSADMFNSIWKNGVLLRLGFTPRVMTDMGLRAMTVLGASRMLGLGREAAGNVMHNVGVSGRDLTNRLLKNRLFTPDTIKSLNDKAGILTTTRDAAQADYTNALMQQKADQQARAAGLASLPGTPTDDQVEKYKQRYDHLVEEVESAKYDANQYQKTRFGDGAKMYKGVPLLDIFGGENREWLAQQVSSARMIGKMFQRNAGMEKGFSGSGAWTTVRADSLNELEAASHPKAWRHAINNQIMNDTLGSQVVKKGWNEQQIYQWLKTSDGKAYMANIPDNFKGGLRDYAHRVASHVHYTVPPAIRQEIIDKNLRGVSEKDLDRLAPNINDRPEVNGQLLNLNMGRTQGITSAMQHWQHGMHKWLGTMPLDTFVYHPTAAAFYRSYVKESIDKYIAANGLEDASSLAVHPDIIRRIEQESFAKAKNDVWSIMYDTSQQSTAAHQLRFIFPFLNAQQEIMKHWFNIMLDHPYIVQRQQQIWNSPAKAGLLYDSTTGEPANSSTPLANQVVRFQVPHALASLPGLGSLQDLGQMQISKGSLNPILQGQHWYIPGAGPMAQVTVQALAKMNPGILDNGVLKQVMPYGPGDNLSSAILPTFAQRLETGFGVNNAQYASTFAKVYQTETIRYNEGMRTSPPTMQEIQSRTQQLLLLQALGSAVLPFSASFNPGTQTGPQKPRAAVTSGLETSSAPDLSKVPIQGLIDQYKKLESVDPANAATNFYNQYGQALFALTMSTTKSNASVPATAAGLAAIQDPDIRSMIQMDPSVAYAIVGPQAASGSFDMAAYQAEMNTQIGGGNTNTFRQRLDPQQMIQEQQAQQGWQQYDQLMSTINAKMAERGLTSLNQSGAQDLKTIKDQFIANINDPSTQDYNPAWYEQYTGAQVDWNARIQSLTSLVSDPNLVNNPGRTDLKSLGQYLEARQEINGYLASRPNKEGLPSTLAAKSNSDLAAQWDAFVSQLVMSNTNFALIYQHLLAGDPVNVGLKNNSSFQQSLSGVVGQ